MNYKKPRLIAEVGCNHKGDLNIAMEYVKIASEYCYVDVVKFQKRNNKELLSEAQYNSPHPNPQNSYGRTYGEHREYLEFTVEEHRELKAICDSFGVSYSSSVWDLTSAKEICSLKPEFIKIPSASNNNFEMLGWLCDWYGGEIHLSLGMTTHDEEEGIVRFFEKQGRNKDLVLYSCTSGYPVPPADVALLEILRIRSQFQSRVKEIGFSGHHLGIAIDIAAYTLGAATIERHFTLDKTWKGTDHAASLEPKEMRQLKSDLEQIYAALSYKREEILTIEKEQRNKLKYREK